MDFSWVRGHSFMELSKLIWGFACGVCLRRVDNVLILDTLLCGFSVVELVSWQVGQDIVS